MGILEHVKVLETKVDKEINLAKRLIDENTQLKEKVETYQKRIEELEALIHSFKEEQATIEKGILSALNRLNQFEDAIEKSLFLDAPAQEDPEYADSEPSGETEEPVNDKTQTDGEGEAPEPEIDSPQNGTE